MAWGRKLQVWSHCSLQKAELNLPSGVTPKLHSSTVRLGAPSCRKHRDGFQYWFSGTCPLPPNVSSILLQLTCPPFAELKKNPFSVTGSSPGSKQASQKINICNYPRLPLDVSDCWTLAVDLVKKNEGQHLQTCLRLTGSEPGSARATK